jgi:hypothetical protein
VAAQAIRRYSLWKFGFVFCVFGLVLSGLAVLLPVTRAASGNIGYSSFRGGSTAPPSASFKHVIAHT